jgi:plasmid stabilization system protein ParE
MSNYQLSNAAAADIEAIARDSVRRWGFTRMEAYVLSMHRACEHLGQRSFIHFNL